MRTLTGASRYTIETPPPVIYHRDEEVPEAHYQLVPKDDRKLFRRVKAAPEAKQPSDSDA